jgi:Periplasmic binding protein
MRTIHRSIGDRSSKGWAHAARIGAAALMVAGLGGGAASCSLIVDTTADACAADGDCKTAGTICDKTANVPHVCVAKACMTATECPAGSTCTSNTCQPAAAGECAKSTDCTSKGQYFVCRQQKCVNLVSTECTTVYTTKKTATDAYLDDNAVFFGSILPTNGGADAPYGKLVEDSIKLAIDDFNKVNGIPSLAGGGNRPLVLVGCNDGSNEDQTDKAAKHLAEDLGIPAIIGYAFSGNTIQVAGDVTIKDQVLLFSPSATSNDITNLNDSDLVWRTAPRDDFQATALSLYYPTVEAAAKAKYPMIASNPIKVAVVHHSDAYGAGLADALQKVLNFNGKPATDPSNSSNYKSIDYGMSGQPDDKKITDVVNFAPDIIFAFGFNEIDDKVFPGVEAQWVAQADMHRPFWVFSDGGQVDSLWSKDITTEDQRTRVSGTVPGVNAQSWAPYNNFLIHFGGSPYSSDGSADTIGPAGAYDIFYLLAYATVMLGNKPLTGPNLVKYGLRKMVPVMGQSLPKVQIDPTTISGLYPMLGTGSAFDIQGASGPLDFNDKGDVKADIQIWCVPPGKGGTAGDPAKSSGLYYDSANGVMAGSISAACKL